MENVFSPSNFMKTEVFRCSRCGTPLTLHQPDPELPDRLLATCDRCKSWYLGDPRKAELIPVDLPKDWLALN